MELHPHAPVLGDNGRPAIAADGPMRTARIGPIPYPDRASSPCTYCAGVQVLRRGGAPGAFQGFGGSSPTVYFRGGELSEDVYARGGSLHLVQLVALDEHWCRDELAAALRFAFTPGGIQGYAATRLVAFPSGSTVVQARHLDDPGPVVLSGTIPRGSTALELELSAVTAGRCYIQGPSLVVSC